MRVVAGTFKGRTLAVPRQAGLRPTSDRVRESVFNVLAHGIEDFEIEGAVVLDLFAGTGALGLEAISRGAAMAGCMMWTIWVGSLWLYSRAKQSSACLKPMTRNAAMARQ